MYASAPPVKGSVCKSVIRLLRTAVVTVILPGFIFKLTSEKIIKKEDYRKKDKLNQNVLY